MNRRSWMAMVAGVLLSPSAAVARLLCRAFLRQHYLGDYGDPRIVDDVIQRSQEKFFDNGLFPRVRIIVGRKS